MYRLYAALLLFLAGCTTKQTGEPVEYRGPLREASNVDMLYAEKDRIKTKLNAKKILEFKNGDHEIPEGLYLENYDEYGNMT